LSIKGIRDEFNQALGDAGNCVTALMDYKRSGGVEYQILFFSGNYADGSEFVIQSNLIRPSGDLLAASRETAQALLQQRKPAT
jgi:hypothetical protein